MKLYTGQMSKAKKEIGFLDITIKSAKKGKIFAPEWYMVNNYKKGLMSSEKYTKIYYQLMRISWKNNKSKWLEILNEDRVVLGCYCRKGDFCHRYLLVDIFEKLCDNLDLPFKYKGEI